ncbi:hypothetical protein [Sulfurimonas sp.]
MGEYENGLLKDAIISDTKKEKHIKLKTNGEFSKGDIFVYETVASVPGERVRGNSMPTLRFRKPAGVRHLIVQGQHFLTDENDGVKGGTLYIGTEKINDSCIHTENIFYSKYEWTIYYEEISKYDDQKVLLKLT